MVPANSNLFDAAPTLPVMQVILAIACTAHFVAEATVCTHPSAQGPLCLFLARPRPPGRVSNPVLEDGPGTDGAPSNNVARVFTPD